MPKEGQELSDREKQVARGLAAGSSAHEIAEDLELSYDTIKAHLARIRVKLNMQRSIQIAVWAAQNLEDEA